MTINNDQTVQKEQNNKYEIIFRLVMIIALACAGIAAVTYFDLLNLSSHFDSRFLIIAALLQILFWLFSSYTWQQVVLISAEVKLPFNDCFSQNALLLVGKYIPGKIWGIIIRGHRLKKFGIDVSVSMHATYLELLNSIHAGFVFGLSCWLIAIDHERQGLVITLGLSSFIILPLVHGKLIRSLVTRTSGKWRDYMEKYAGINLSVHDYLHVTCLYLMEWLLLGAIAVFVFTAMTGGLPTAVISLLLIGSNAVAMVAGFVALFAPAGIGVREVVNGGMLLNSLSISEITGLVILLRCWGVCADIIVGGLAFILRGEDS